MNCLSSAYGEIDTWQEGGSRAMPECAGRLPHHPGRTAPGSRPRYPPGGRKQRLDNLRRKDSLGGAETTEILVRLGIYSASHFEGSARSASGALQGRAAFCPAACPKRR